jgi:hypothetical protein
MDKKDGTERLNWTGLKDDGEEEIDVAGKAHGRWIGPGDVLRARWGPDLIPS